MAIPTADEIWRDNDADGTPHEPIKDDIRRYLNSLSVVASANGMKTYPNKATMDADTGQPVGKPALLYADPVAANNYPTIWTWNGGAWVAGVDRISSLAAQVNANAGAIADVNAGLIQQPQQANFQYRTGYAQSWTTISSPATRWTVTETDGSFKIDTTAALPQPWPIGIKLPYDLVPGDVIEAEFKITAGTIDGTVGPYIGTDPATSGDISAGAILYHWRNAAAAAGIYGQNSTGTGGVVAGYATVPQAGTDAPSVPFVLNDVLKIIAKVKANRSLTLELYVNGALKITLGAPGVLPVGRVVVGILPPVSGSAIITQVKRTGFVGQTVYIDSQASISGNGSNGAPVKTWSEAVAIAQANRLSVCDVVILSAELRGAIIADDKLFSRYRIRGRGGSQTKIIAADYSPNDWQLLGGTTRVWFRPNKNAAGSANTTLSGTVYFPGVPNSPYPWITLEDSWLPYFTGAPADLEGQTQGGRRVSGGNLYVSMPESFGTAPNDTIMEVNTSAAVLYCVGAPQLEVENIVFSRGGNDVFFADRATAVFRHCRFEWGEVNGTQDSAGNVYYFDCEWHGAFNDLAARTFPAGYAETLLMLPVSYFSGCRMYGTLQGDGIAHHGSTVAIKSRMRVHDCDIFDCAKDGIVPASCDFEISGCRIRRCANAQIEIIGGGTGPSLPTGMSANGSITDCTLDPAGVGLYGFLQSGAAGGKIVTTIDRCHFSTPVNGELWGNVSPVAGRTSVPADFTTTVTASTFERDLGDRVVRDNGAVTFVVNDPLGEVQDVLGPISEVIIPDGATTVDGLNFILRFSTPEPSNRLLGGITDQSLFAMFKGFLLAGVGGGTLRRSADPGVICQWVTANGRVKMRLHSDPAKDIIPGGGGSSAGSNPLGAQLVMYPVYGQSLGEGAEALPPMSLSPTGSNAFKFARGVRTFKLDAWALNPTGRPASDFDFVPLTEQVDGATGETIATSFAAMVKELVIGPFSPLPRTGEPQILVTFPGRGGRLLDELSKVPVVPDGVGDYYGTLIDDVRRAKQYAVENGMSFAVGGIIWMQGEANNGLNITRGGPVLAYSDFIAQYSAGLIALADNLDADIRAITQQSGRIPFFTYSTSGTVSAQAQYKAAETAPAKIIPVGPTYYVPGARNSYYGTPQQHGAELHLAADGERWFGSNVAKVIYRSRVLRETNVSLKPLFAKRIDATTFDVTFSVPRPPIRIDTALLPLQGAGAAGFTLYNGTYGGLAAGVYPTPGPVITGVSVVDVDRLRFTTGSNLPAGTVSLTYGQDPKVFTVPAPVAIWRDGAVLPNGNASKELVFAGSHSALFAKLLEEGAFMVDRLAPTLNRKAWVGRTVTEAGGQTIIRGEAGEVTVGSFAAGDTIQISRQGPYGNVADSDAATSTLSFADHSYGSRTGPYPLANWLIPFADLVLT